MVFTEKIDLEIRNIIIYHTRGMRNCRENNCNKRANYNMEGRENSLITRSNTILD